MKLCARVLANGVVALLALLSAPLAALAAQGTDIANLVDIYEKALRNDPQIREADANRLANRESKPQALSSLLPQINANGSYTQNENETTRVQPSLSDPTDPNSPIVPRTVASEGDTTVRNYDITLRQTLF